MLGIDARRLQRGVVVSRVGVEPTTHGLKVRCSTAELPAHGKEYTQREGEIASTGAATAPVPSSAPLAKREQHL